MSTALNTDIAVTDEQPPAPVPADATTKIAADAAPISADSSDDELDAALAAAPNLHTAAVDHAGASFHSALQALTDNPTPGGGHPAHLLGFEQQRYWPRISQGVHSLNRLAAIAGGDPAVVASTKRELLRTALTMGGVFDRIVNPTTRDKECDRICCALTPGSFVRPYRKPEPLKDGDLAPVPLHMHPATRAREALTQWKGRGVRVERAGDGLRLTGPTHAGDLANAAELKAEILSQLPAEVVV